MASSASSRTSRRSTVCKESSASWQLEDELTLDPTLDAALRRIREGAAPRVLILDLSDSTAPIAELSAARSVGGADLKILALGTVNDVGLFRDLLSAGASDYLVKPVSRESLAISLEKRGGTATGGPGAGLGQVVAFIGSRGGVGTSTTAVACAWLLAERHKESTALLDLDLHFGTVALNLDTDPGSGLCEALEQPSRIDALFVDRATVKVSDTLRILAAEAAVAETLMIDAGAIDVLLYELRRKFAWVVIDLPRWVTPTQRVVLGCGEPRRHFVRTQPCRVARHDPAANIDARARAANAGVAGRRRRQR